MLFRKDIEPRCAYCFRGSRISETEVICVRHGIMAEEDCCGAFRYDPFKRVPPRPVSLEVEKHRPEDFDI